MANTVEFISSEHVRYMNCVLKTIKSNVKIKGKQIDFNVMDDNNETFYYIGKEKKINYVTEDEILRQFLGISQNGYLTVINIKTGKSGKNVKFNKVRMILYDEITEKYFFISRENSISYQIQKDTQGKFLDGKVEYNPVRCDLDEELSVFGQVRDKNNPEEVKIKLFSLSNKSITFYVKGSDYIMVEKMFSDCSYHYLNDEGTYKHINDEKEERERKSIIEELMKKHKIEMFVAVSVENNVLDVYK